MEKREKKKLNMKIKILIKALIMKSAKEEKTDFLKAVKLMKKKQKEKYSNKIYYQLIKIFLLCMNHVMKIVI